MENTQAEVSIELARLKLESKDISMPLQTLFDECLSFISANDFNP
jgi:hypothetical protein